MIFELTVILFIILLIISSPGCDNGLSPGADRQYPEQEEESMPEKVVKTDEEWRQLLIPEQYAVTRQKGTEPPFTGQYYDFHKEGIYRCIS